MPPALRVCALALIFTGPAALAQSPPESQAKTAAEMKPYKFTIPNTEVSFEMVPIPGGTYTIGSPEGEEGRSENEGPQREVELKPFWMGKFEVTWDEYDLFAFSQDIRRKQVKGIDAATQPETEKLADAITRPTRPYADETFGLGRKRQPVICITHHAAMEYCRWLSTKTGQTYRLATEAEWEYACRAGTETPWSFGDDPEALPQYAHARPLADNCAIKTAPVGRLKPNAWGLFDFHGNVAEWCLDPYIDDYHAATGFIDPRARSEDPDGKRVLRGGSFVWSDPGLFRCAYRDGQIPIRLGMEYAGFRVVCEVGSRQEPAAVEGDSRPLAAENPQPARSTAREGINSTHRRRGRP